jgi:hypothetical protein
LSQQTPSTQSAELHSLAAAHAVPFAFFPAHTPALQKSPVMQSASEPHVVMHDVAEQTYGAQIFVEAGGHAPAPSQMAEAVAMPDVQLAARHDVVGYVHDALDPLHVPAHVPLPAHTARDPCGAPETNEHVPTDPPTSHAWHCAAQGVLQHTPSMQFVELHCEPEVHADPFESFPPQVPPMQMSPATQSVSTVHDVLHEVDPHAYGAHEVVDAAGQFPAPSQFAPAVAVPPVQLALRQFVDVGGYAHALVAPLQLPPHGVVPAPVHAPRVPCGCPLGTLVHVPMLPPMSHASH